MWRLGENFIFLLLCIGNVELGDHSFCDSCKAMTETQFYKDPFFTMLRKGL